MPEINILPKSVAELIAAGEVVERPSSAVKELIENSIDAGADSISVEIRNGGIKYIRVTDNGCGIDRENAPAAFMSHATSKIKTGSDINSVLTLGFRGEALPSVAAVSRLSMLTKTAGENIGTAIEIEGGELKSIDDAGCPDGTTVIIKDLFYNTPARMKFLKRDITEAAYVVDVAAKAAIACPGIRFSCVKDGKSVFSTPGSGDLRSAVYSAIGKEVSEGLIECSYRYEDIKIEGLISKPLSNRPNRNLQYCYVNGRFVRVPAVAAALDEAYRNRITVGKFPMCFLFIEIAPEKTDVNVHPAKIEIRFSADAPIFEAVYYAAKCALNKGDTERPSVILKNKNAVLERKPAEEEHQVSIAETTVGGRQVPESIVADTTPLAAADLRVLPSVLGMGTFRSPPTAVDCMLTPEEVKNENKKIAAEFAASQIHLSSKNIDIAVDDDAAKKAENVSFDDASFAADKVCGISASAAVPEFTIIGEAFKTYIIAQQGDRLLIVDKHAAHERMIFDSLTARKSPTDAQLLMCPITVALSGREYASVLDNLEVFSSGGFLVEDFGKNIVIVRGCPITLDKEDISSIITEIAGELARGNLRPKPEKLDRLYSSVACRAAVKAGDAMRPGESEALVARLLADESVLYCPHGRPVMYVLTKRELEKQFGRV